MIAEPVLTLIPSAIPGYHVTRAILLSNNHCARVCEGGNATLPASYRPVTTPLVCIHTGLWSYIINIQGQHLLNASFRDYISFHIT